jgi:hypothetical protein
MDYSEPWNDRDAAQLTEAQRFTLDLMARTEMYAKAHPDYQAVLTGYGLGLAMLLASIGHSRHLFPEEIEAMMQDLFDTIRTQTLDWLAQLDRGDCCPAHEEGGAL